MLLPKITRHDVILLTALLALLLPTAWIEYGILQHTHGTFAYPFDDTFLNLTIAKNLAFEHVWGITKYSFISASSSPLYTFGLAIVFLVTGTYLIVPLLVNTIIAIVFLRTLHRWLIRQGLTAVGQLSILLAVIILAPLPLLVISGMEYTLQLLLSFLFIYSFSEAIEENTAGKDLPRKVYVYGLLMVTTSYETLSVLAIACVLLLLRRQGWTAFKLLLLSLLPIYLFGILALVKHNYFIPNSLLLTWGMPQWHNFFFASHDYNLLTAQRLLLILPLIYLLFLGKLRQLPAYRYSLIILMGAAACHLLLTPSSNYPRYEAWLVGCSIIFCGPLIIQYSLEALKQTRLGPKWITYPLILILATPLLKRSWTGFTRAGTLCVNVYQEQYQMAKFFRAYYYDDRVASNEIGAVSFWSDKARILDLTGNADLEVLKNIRQHSWSPAMADSLSELKEVKVAALHHSWSDTDTDPYWYKIASWQTPTDSVSFYSIDWRGVKKLQKDLHEYQPRLPAGITVRYYKPTP